MKQQPMAEDLDECDEQHSDALLELSAPIPPDTQSDWAVGMRWIVVLSVIAWLIVLTVVLLASRHPH